jgi:hypothetical protein
MARSFGEFLARRIILGTTGGEINLEHEMVGRKDLSDVHFIKKPESEKGGKVVQAPKLNPVQKKVSGMAKLLPLLRDGSVNAVWCEGVGKDLIVQRGVQKLPTKLQLDADELEAIFKEITDKENIPLIEGGVKVHTDNFTFTGIYSREVDSRFVIRKDIPTNPVPQTFNSPAPAQSNERQTGPNNQGQARPLFQPNLRRPFPVPGQYNPRQRR